MIVITDINSLETFTVEHRWKCLDTSMMCFVLHLISQSPHTFVAGYLGYYSPFEKMPAW